jgi:hypothetical protein
MKKSLIVVLAVLCVAAFVPQALQAGITLKGGLSMSKFSLQSTEPPPFTFGNLNYYVGGLSLGINLGIVSIQPEVLYTRMGARYAVDPDSLEYRFDYIQVPVLLKINIIPAGPLRPFICGGGYGSYLLKAKGVMVSGGETTEEDLADTFEKYDYGVVGGAGLAFHLPGITLSAEGRYNLGLKNILKDPAAGDSVKNRSIMVLLGIGF